MIINFNVKVASPKLPQHVREQFKDARELLKKRDVGSARAKLLEIDLGSSYVLFHRMMAACAFIEKDYDLAASYIEQAIAIEPDKQPTIADAIRIYKLKKDEKRALELLKSFDISKSDSGSELLRVSLAMKSVGKYTDASYALEKALRISPDNVRIRNQYGIILTHVGKLDEATNQWIFSLKFNPSDVQAMVCLGRMHLHRGESLKSIEYFKRTIDDDSKGEGRKLNLAEAYVKSSSLSEARTLLSSVTGMETNPRYHYLWGTLHTQSSDQYLAYSSFSRCIELGKQKDPGILNGINWPDTFPGDEQTTLLLKGIRPTLDSRFDALSLLKASGDASSIDTDSQSVQEDDSIF